MEGCSSAVPCRVPSQIVMVSAPVDYLGIAAVGFVSLWRQKCVINMSNTHNLLVCPA